MTIWETGMAMGVMLLLVAGYFATQSEVLEADDARLRATAIERMHAAVEEYVRNDYAFLEQCLKGPGLEEKWNEEAKGGQAGPFKAVRLYPTPIAEMPEDAHAQALTKSKGDLICDDPTLGAPRSLREAGLLPAMLAARRYDATGTDVHDSSNLWRGLDFRLLIRMVNLIREPPDLKATPPIAAHVGLQAVLAMQARSGEAMSEHDAGTVLRMMTIGEGGILRSVNVGDTIAEHTIAGRNGGWRMELCSSAGVAGLQPCGELDFGFQRIDVEEDSPERYAFISDPGGDPTARLVTVTSVGREEGLLEVLHRADIGIPEANRMETDIDMGAYGLLNVAYLTGIDEDGDGLIDRGVGLIGPQRRDPEAPPTREYPVTVYGDLHVRGAVHVGAGIDSDDEGDVADEFDTNIPPGSLWAQGGIQVGDGDDSELGEGDGFDEHLPSGAILVTRGMQVGGSLFGISYDDDPLTTKVVEGADGAMWARGGVQIGDVDAESHHDPYVPAGALLVTGGRIGAEVGETVGEIRSSGGLRVVGRNIVLAASNSSDPSRAGPRRGWDAVAEGLGHPKDRGGLPDTVVDTYDSDDGGGRIQFRSEGDDLRMVMNSGSLRVMPAEHVVDATTRQSVQLSAVLTDDLPPDPPPTSTVLDDDGNEVTYEVRRRETDAWLVVNSEDIWVNEVVGERPLKSRSLFSALPTYVSKQVDLNQSWEKEGDVWKVLNPDVTCPDLGESHHVLSPVSWSRTGFAGTSTFHVNLQKWIIPRMPIIIPTPWVVPIIIPRWTTLWAPLIWPWGDQAQIRAAIPGSFTLHHPYLGWSIDPETGNDNTLEVPNDDALGYADFTRHIYCDYSSTPLWRPSETGWTTE